MNRTQTAREAFFAAATALMTRVAARAGVAGQRAAGLGVAGLGVAGVGVTFLGVAFLGVTGLAGCVGEAEPYFSSSAKAPSLSGVFNSSAQDEGGHQQGLMGGYPVTLIGSDLKGDQLSVRFGDRAATVLAYDVDAGHISVLSPPGPVGGGRVDVIVSHAGGVATLRDAYEYRVGDEAAFAGEAGSLELIGYSPTQVSGALRFWPGYHPRRAGSLFPEGALYYLPGPEQVNEPVAWTSWEGIPSASGLGSSVVVDQISLSPAGSSNVVPFTFVRDPLTGLYSLCGVAEGQAATWTAGASYKVSITGGALAEPKTVALASPPGITADSEAPEGLIISSDGVAQVNVNVDLHLRWTPPEFAEADAAYLLVELVEIAPDASLPERPFEIARINVRGDDEAGVADLSVADLSALPELDTSCALLARRLASARMTDDPSVSSLEAEFTSAGCEGVDDPVAANQVSGLIRITRHYVHRVELGTAAGCLTPGACPPGSALVVDLVSAYQIPASFLDLPVTACENGEDDDGDGLIDLADPGCDEYLDSSEQNAAGPECDNGVDDDHDGLLDYRADLTGDPGCERPGDLSEKDTTDRYVCDNGVDDDGDGRTDFRLESALRDPGCTSVYDTSEWEATLVCDNGQDDDFDGKSDYRASTSLGDPGCSTLVDPTEKDETGQWPCDDDKDNDGDGLSDQEDHGCRENPTNSLSYSPYEADEYNPIVQCDNSIDDDKDGFTDFRVKPDANGDLECKDANDNSEFK